MPGYDFGNPFFDTYYGVGAQERAKAHDRGQGMAEALRMAQGIDSLQEARRQRQFSNLDQAMKFEADRAMAGIDETAGPPRPGDAAVFKIAERAPVNFGELPGGVNAAEIARIADERAKRFETERIRKQTGEDLTRELASRGDVRAQKAAEIAARSAGVMDEYHRAMAAKALRPPGSGGAVPKSLIDAYRIAGNQLDKLGIEYTKDDILEYGRQMWADAQGVMGRSAPGAGGGPGVSPGPWRPEYMPGAETSGAAKTGPAVPPAAKASAAAAASITPSLPGVAGMPSYDKLRAEFELSKRPSIQLPAGFDPSAPPKFDAAAMNAEIAKMQERRNGASPAFDPETGAYVEPPKPAVQPRPTRFGERPTPQVVKFYIDAAGGNPEVAKQWAAEAGWGGL